VHHVAEAADGTAKLLLRLSDDRVVEAVGIPVGGCTG
jgi:adenine C2-methylase RlmN of 23S rRNA A2503 and tRNA A37